MKPVFRFELQREEGVIVREYPYKEVQSLAMRLGMDLEADAGLEWFLKQALITLLPSGWKRESDPKGRIQYHNAQTQATTGTHPLLFQYRCAFFRLLQRRLLPDGPEAQQMLFKDLVKENIHDSSSRKAALKDAEDFYASIIRLGEGRPPRFIEEAVEYQQASPQAVLDMANRLGIRSELRLYWVARMALALPLPPCFESIRDELGSTKYMNTEYSAVLDAHPCLHFLQKQLVRLRTTPIQRTADIMFFYDKDFMPYVIDLQSLARGEPQTRISLDAKGLTKLRKELYKAERDMRDVIDDMMLLELVKSGQLEQDEVHLYGLVAQFIQELKQEGLFEKWQFRYTLEGERYWFHTPEERAYRQFPYAKALKRLIKRKRKRGVRKHPQCMRPPLLRHVLFTQLGEDFYHQVRSEALDLMRSAVRTMLETNHFRMPEEELDISELLKPLDPMDKEQALDLLFACPYDLTHPSLSHHLQDTVLDVSTDSEILREAGFKLEGDKLVFVVAEPMERSGAFRSKKLMKTRILPRRKEAPLSGLKPEHLLPFQVQIGRVLRQLKSLKHQPKPESSSSESLSSEEEPGSLPSWSTAPMQRARTQLELLRVPTQLRTEPLFPSKEKRPSRRSSLSDDEISAVLTPEQGGDRGIGATADQIPVITVHKAEGSHQQRTLRLSSDAATSQSQEDSARPTKAPSSNYLLDHRPSKIVLEVVGTANERWLETSPKLKPTSGGWEGVKVGELGVLGVGKKILPVDAKADINVKIPLRIPSHPSQTNVHFQPASKTSAPRSKETGLPLDTAPSKTSVPHQQVATPSKGTGLPLDTAPSSSPRAPSLSPSLSPTSSRAVTSLPWRRDRSAREPMTAASSPQPYKFDPRVKKQTSLPHSPSASTSPRSPLPLLSERAIGHITARNQETRGSEFSEGVVTPSGSKPKTMRGKRLAIRVPGEGLPENFVLSPRAETSRAAVRTEAGQPAQMRNFLHYLKVVGFPLSLQSGLQPYSAPQDVLPKHVVLMGRRLGLRVSLAKLTSVESDLLWIPLLQLSAPLPSPCDAPVTAALQVLLPVGKHPGDEYFRLLTGFNRKERVKELTSMSPENRVASMIHESWLRLSLRHQFYCYNFLTGARIRTTSDEPEAPLERDQRAEYLQQFLESRTALDLASLLVR